MLLTRHDDLKEMLDTNKDSLKLEAMKRIVAVRSREGTSLGEGPRLKEQLSLAPCAPPPIQC